MHGMTPTPKATRLGAPATLSWPPAVFNSSATAHITSRDKRLICRSGLAGTDGGSARANVVRRDLTGLALLQRFDSETEVVQPTLERLNAFVFRSMRARVRTSER